MYKPKCTSEGCEYYVVDFDARGCIKNHDDVWDMLRRELQDTSKEYTDVVLISHGYKNQPEEDGSHKIANLIVPSSEACIPGGRTCLYVAVGWPSIIPTIFDEKLHAPKQLISDVIGKLHEAFGSDDSNTTSRSFPPRGGFIDKLKKQAELFLSRDENDDNNSNSPSSVLPRHLCESISSICNELNKQGAQTDGSTRSILDGGNMRYPEITPEFVQERFKTVRSQNRGSPNSAEPSTENKSIGFSSIRDAMKKKQKDVLFTLFDLIYLTFERRAAIVGSTGVHDLLAKLMCHARKEVRFHLFAHSMGSVVAMSTAIGASESKLTRRIHTMILVQAAVSAQPYAPGEPYRPIVSGLCPIAGPILCTAWKIDEALIKYDNWLDTPLGRIGFTNTAPFNSETIMLKENDEQIIEFRKNTCYTLQAKDDGIIGTHEDIADREVLRLFWQAATIAMDENDFSVTDPAELPKNYWTNYDVRTEKSESDK